MKILSYSFSFVCGVAAVILGGAAFSHQPTTHRKRSSRARFSGKEAADYLVQTDDGQSLARAVTAARFGLQPQDHAPGDNQSAGGYLALSHEQNLNAWFDEGGMVVRPTLPETKRDQAWSVALRLQAYGYGTQLSAVPPIVSHHVRENRIEYLRQNQKPASVFSNRKSKIENPKLIEWYENRKEGIEQGFTLNERPERNGVVVGEPLRVLLAVTGDLTAGAKDGTGRIELADRHGTGALSYSKLVAQDADGKWLAARMEASADGREIALVVDDAGARYPIVIDPIVATLEKKLEAFTVQQTDARFGSAVAIDGNTAVVGAWREDAGATPDVGVVYIFTRSGSTWTLKSRNDGGTNAGDACGWSVAINGSRIVYGCPGANNNSGRAFFRDTNSGKLSELPPVSGSYRAGDRFGESVAINFGHIIVGSPFYDITGANDAGLIHHYTFDANSNLTLAQSATPTVEPGAHLGASLAIASDNTLIVGAPGAGTAGQVLVMTASPSLGYSGGVQPSNGKAGDQFGQSVAISGNTFVVGAGTNDDKGTDAGAAYVFVRGSNGNFSQQQELTASDGSSYNYFGFSAVAIEGNTIVVGSYGWEPTNNITDEFGKAYVFTRNGSVWTQQTEIFSSDNNAGDSFGISVGLSGNSVIAGARVATATGVARAGAAYVYRLDCTPPYGSRVILDTGITIYQNNVTWCPGTAVRFIDNVSSGGPAASYQWRKNGLNIPGATNIDYPIASLSASDAGTYDAIATNSCGSDISAPFTLTLYTFSLNPTSQNFGVSGSTGIVNVTSTGNCSWTAVSNSSFITVNSGASGTGNGTVGFTVAANPNSGQRTGTITIAGLPFTVAQDGTNCSYSIAPTSKTLGASASTNTVDVTASAGCAWAAASNDPFLSVNSGASGSGNGTVTYTIAANFSTSPRTGTLTIAGQTFTVTQAGAGFVANVSTRLPVGTDANVLIEGFIVDGPAGSTKKIIVRAIGPSLLPFGVTDALANPTLEIFDASNTKIASNDNWRTTQVGGLITGDQSAEISNSGVAPSNDLEAAIIANLAPGGYTAVVRGADNMTGTGVVDAYDLSAASPAKLANISTRGLIQAGDKLMIAGFIIQNAPVRAVVRAIGPSLLAFGINNALSDTTLQLRDANGQIVLENDNWKSDQRQELENTGLQPSDDLEAALVTTMQPGLYTAQVRGKDDANGVGVVQVYFLQ